MKSIKQFNEQTKLHVSTIGRAIRRNGIEPIGSSMGSKYKKVLMYDEQQVMAILSTMQSKPHMRACRKAKTAELVGYVPRETPPGTEPFYNLLRKMHIVRLKHDYYPRKLRDWSATNEYL